MQSWLSVDGDNTFAIDWPHLNEHSIVFEVGAYKGRWAKQIADKYGCTVYAFEPQTWAYEEIVKLNNPNICPLNYGLGVKTETVMLGEYDTDACSVYTTNSRKDGYGDFLEAEQAFLSLGLVDRDLDLMMMNIEGYEYDLIPHMIDSGLVLFFKTICVQWHTFRDETGYKYNKIRSRLSDLGYTLKWSFFPTLECWSRIDG